LTREWGAKEMATRRGCAIGDRCVGDALVLTSGLMFLLGIVASAAVGCRSFSHKQEMYVADWVILFCKSTNGKYVYDDSAAACNHLSTVMQLFFGVKKEEADIRVATEYMFPAAVTASNPTGKAKLRASRYFRRPIAHWRGRMKVVALEAYLLHLNRTAGVGTMTERDTVALSEDDVINLLENDVFWRGNSGKGGVCAALAALHKEMGEAKGWFVACTPENPASYMRVSVPTLALVHFWVRRALGVGGFREAVRATVGARVEGNPGCAAALRHVAARQCASENWGSVTAI